MRGVGGVGLRVGWGKGRGGGLDGNAFMRDFPLSLSKEHIFVLVRRICTHVCIIMAYLVPFSFYIFLSFPFLSFPFLFLFFPFLFF